MRWFLTAWSLGLLRGFWSKLFVSLEQEDPKNIFD
jgi:hypothetical protein